MIYYSTTKDMMKLYTSLPLDVVEKTNFVILSSKIRVTKDRDNVILASNLFINAGKLKGVGYELEPDSPLINERFRNFLLEHPKALRLITGILENELTTDETTILLCTPMELDCNYMQKFAEVVNEMFSYKINRYPQEAEYDLEDLLKRLIYYNKQLKRNRFRFMSEGERLIYVQKLSKKALKKLLKKYGEDPDGLDRKDMEHILLSAMKDDAEGAIR